VFPALVSLAIIWYQQIMDTSIADTNKKRGRPETGIGPNVGLRLYPELEKRLDAWIAKQGEPNVGRPEAIRRLLAAALGVPDEAQKERPRRMLALFDDGFTYLAIGRKFGVSGSRARALLSKHFPNEVALRCWRSGFKRSATGWKKTKFEAPT
jgi:hypothetical protein